MSKLNESDSSEGTQLLKWISLKKLVGRLVSLIYMADRKDLWLAFADSVNLLAPELIFLILAHSVYKIWIIQERNRLELWNKLNFEEKNTESI